jgi:hypothetical protein
MMVTSGIVGLLLHAGDYRMTFFGFPLSLFAAVFFPWAQGC